MAVQFWNATVRLRKSGRLASQYALQNQVAFLQQFCNAKGIIVDQCIEDYGSGLNYNRKKWNELLDEVMEQKIKTSCRILFQYSMCSPAGCTDFVSIKNK